MNHVTHLHFLAFLCHGQVPAGSPPLAVNSTIGFTANKGRIKN